MRGVVHFSTIYYTVPMIQAYIDESGDMGHGGKYFVLAAAVFTTPESNKIAKRTIHKFQLYLSAHRTRPIAEVKSRNLKFEQRQSLLSRLVKQSGFDIFYLVVDKDHVSLLQQDKPKNLVYNYFAKLLTDQIFAYYYDDFRITFDLRTTSVKSMNSLVDYITINAYTYHNHDCHNIHVEQKDSKLIPNIQIADVIAGTVLQAYYKQNRHFLDLIQEHVTFADEFPRFSFSGSLLPSRINLPSTDTASY